MLTPAIVEFLGTGLLVGAVAFGGPLLIVAALAIAISLGGRISGGHFNPAITLFTWMSGKMSNSRALSYILAQSAAGGSIALLRNMM
jgi:aquaporin Z